MATSLPTTMKVWQYSSTRGGLEKNLKLNQAAPLPKPKNTQHLVQVIATALNPIDYKPAELPVIGRMIVPKLATPGIDFAGCIVTSATGSNLKPGQLVFGVGGSSPVAGGALGEFALAGIDAAVAVPDGMDPLDVATIGVAGLTAYQSIVPRVKRGDRIFINGGSGGTGVFGIQIAKAVGCHVTTTCSTPNVELCKSLGADKVLDYRKASVLEALKASGHKFDHAVDNVGTDPQLYWQCHEYMKPGAAYVMVGADISFDGFAESWKRKFLPRVLGGVKGNLEGFWPKPDTDHLTHIAQWMKEGKVKPVFDHKFAFSQAPEAFEKLKTGRAKGKIVIDVSAEKYRKLWV